MQNGTLASRRANCWAMQIRGPQLNGRNAPGFLEAWEIPLVNLSGLNSCTSLPHISGSWFINNKGSSMRTPAGYVMLPIFISLYVLRKNATAGEYNRSTSYRIMVTVLSRLTASYSILFFPNKPMTSSLPCTILPLWMHT